jgi:hypothetical protein
MTDKYEYDQSIRKQTRSDYSPYVDKQYNGFVNDLNSGVYTNNSLSLVQFDLGQIYNSQKYTDANDLFLVIPITMVAAFSTGVALVAPTAGNSALLSLKTNFVNLIHQVDLQINGKTIESTQPFINVAKNFQMMSEMSINDQKTIGFTYGFSEELDNPRSVRWNGNSVLLNGNGFTNNIPFVAAAGLASTRTQSSMGATQNIRTTNNAIQSKISRFADTTIGGAYNNIYGAGAGVILNSTQLNNEFRPTYQTINGDNYMVWYDYAVIKLSTVLESLESIRLVKKFDCSLRFWINTGTLNVTVANPNATTLRYSLTPANNTFSSTCPFTVNYLPDTAANGGIPNTTTNIVAGCYIRSPPTTSFAGVNLGASGASHPMPACRIYYSQIQMDAEKSIKYLENSRNKNVVFRNVLSNQFSAIGSGNTFNQLINAGITHPTGILIVPYISSTATGFGDFQWKSPFDTCPATSSPCSLTNLQVSVGGVNMLQSTLYYNYEHFIEQINLAEQLTSSDFGVSVGLFNQLYWETFKNYYVNIERSAIADKLQPRNINVSFVNNSTVPIDILVFIFYSDEFKIDCETGIITK